MLFLIICIFPIASSRLRGHIYYIEFVQLQRIAKYTRFDICVVRCFRIYIDCRIICFVFVSRKILCIRLDHFTFYFFHPNWLFSGAFSYRWFDFSEIMKNVSYHYSERPPLSSNTGTCNYYCLLWKFSEKYLNH